MNTYQVNETDFKPLMKVSVIFCLMYPYKDFSQLTLK